MFKKHYQAYLTILVLTLALMTIQSRYGAIRPFGFVSSALNTVGATIVYMKQGYSTFARVALLNERELVDLRRRNLELRISNNRYMELHRENQRLKQLLDITDETPGMVAVARVISKGGAPLSRRVIIDKGARHGIRKDMIVIVPEGLVGKILSTQSSFSTVLLMDDTSFSAAVRLNDSRTEAIFSGTGNSKGMLKYLRTDIPVQKDSTLSTSGLDALFPAGIPVGRVVEVETDTDVLFHSITVSPVADLSKIEEVLIVTR